MKTKTVKIALDSYGSFLGRAKGCLVVRDREGSVKRYPLSENEIAEIRIRSGNTVSAGALATCGFWGIDCLILTRWGNPIAIVKSLVADSHVETRICQYEALTNGKGLKIAKQFVLGKLRGYDELLKKYGLRHLDSFQYSEQVKELDDKDLNVLRNKLTSTEGKFSRQYFSQLLQLFNESFRPEGRKTYKAYDIANNVLNLGYSVLFWKIQLSLMKARLESYLGFLHSIQWGLPALICDFQELYRYLIDDFVIQYFRSVKSRDCVLKIEDFSGKKGRRQFLSDGKAREMVSALDKYFETMVSVPRIRRGRKQELETLINEEALLLAQYLRNEKPTWQPRFVTLS